ncbi:unnamed protein product [Strongylus vulgaris]|uniref:PWWP domain-containing protein n=1 Tax=Strongylus vulgaris TaxID=40348 RepID=A0A3P7IWW9_STRVU|nr:unnamed protein product [Strongylus vulgaris]
MQTDAITSQCDLDGVDQQEKQMNNSPLFEDNIEIPSEHLSAETDNSSPHDGLCIAEEESPLNRSEPNSDRRQAHMESQERGDEQRRANVKREPVNFDEGSQAISVQVYHPDGSEGQSLNASEHVGSDVDQHRGISDHPVDPTINYRYKMWSNAYKTFRTNPFIISPDSGQEPNERNWKEIYVGDVLWVRWRKNEYWPATAYSISDTAPVKVTVLWINDKTQSTVDYTQVDSFDMAFHIRYDARRNDPKYVKAVATALRFMGKMGFWECHITAKVYDEIVKEEGESFCRHIFPDELKRIKEKSKAPKLAKETKKEDLTKMQRSEEVLQALQAAHFIDIYQRSPLVGNALPLTQQIVDDYQGSKEYASGNLDPLFVDGSMLSFDEDVKVFNIDPAVMGSNEIVQWDGDSGMVKSGHDATDAYLGYEPPDDVDAVTSSANAFDGETKEEVKLSLRMLPAIYFTTEDFVWG